MNIKFKENMTSKMLNVVSILENNEELKEEFQYCNERYLEALKACSLVLPHKLENGEYVVQDAKKEVRIMVDYWEKRRNLVEQLLPQEWVKEELNIC